MPERSEPSGVRSLPDAIRRDVEAGYLPPGTDPTALRMVDRAGEHATRQVTYFRVFDAGRAARDGLDIQRYADLDDHLELVVRAGYVEADGTVVMAHGRPIGVRPIPRLPDTGSDGPTE